jgi:hypothetical protein
LKGALVPICTKSLFAYIYPLKNSIIIQCKNITVISVKKFFAGSGYHLPHPQGTAFAPTRMNSTRIFTHIEHMHYITIAETKKNAIAATNEKPPQENRLAV